jgi:hypothetical protein
LPGTFWGPPVLVSLHNCLRASKDAQEALVRVRSGKDTIYREQPFEPPRR